MRILILSGAMLAVGGCCFGGSSAPAAAPINIAPGFQPQPTTATGSAGGITDATTLNSECRGNIPLTPQHTLNVTAQIPNLTIMVNCPLGDTTLVVRTPTGQYLCNDDTDGLNPVVSGAFAPGTYEVFVGSYTHDSTGLNYRIGFTEQAGAMPSSLPAP
ncbi:MAG: hypothetical protein OHK0013_33550 [Sandaracinaceae bacterium]